jgi:hypothetical protein
LILSCGLFALEFWPVFYSLALVQGRHRRDDAASRNAASPDAVDHFLSSAVRGFHGDSKRSK